MGTTINSNPLSIVADYDELQFINNLQAYNGSRGTDEMLDMMREIQQSGNYYWQGVCFPTGGNTTVGAYATVNGTIQVPSGSWVTGMTSYNVVGGAGFKFKLYDKGSKASIFYGDYAKANVVSSVMQLIPNNPPSDAGMNGDSPFGPNLLMNPFIINDPGVLGWEIVNLDSIPAVLQVMLSIAVPINAQSIGQRLITVGG